jgi:long-chain acyl-CoA synthetase
MRVVTRKEALAQLTAPGQPMELVEIEAIGRKVLAFKNAPPTLRELFAETRSDKTFLVYENERLTFEETWRKACALAHALVEDYGVGMGDRIAISMRNYPEWMIAFMAVTSIGAVAEGLNAMWQSDEMDYALSFTEPKLLIADGERLERLAACQNAPADLPVIAVRAGGPLPANAAAFDDLVARHPADEMPAADFGPDDDATMLFTSGSTGAPKGVVSTHRMVISALLSWELDAQAAVMTGLIPAPDPDAPQTCALLGIPLFHVTGLHAVYLACYRYQRRLVSMYKWDAAKAAEIIDAEKVTHFTAPSAVTGDLVNYARKHGLDFPSMQQLGGGGASRAPEQVRAIDEVTAAARPGIGWGMTETNAIGAGIAGDDYLKRPESTGRSSAVLEFRIVDSEGNEVPTGERGELQVRGTAIMRGYYKRPDADAEAFTDGDWLRTGDVAIMDDEEFVYIVDRLKDLVIRGGENIGCGPVEYALQEHPAVVEACVYGVPDERLGEEVGATLYTNTPVTEDELRQFLAGRLAKFQIPRYFIFADEPLPRGATGKVMKKELRAEAAAALSKEKVEA